MITPEEYEQLLPYEADFRRAVKAQYKLPTPASENQLVEKILRKYEPKERFNWSCGNCALRVYTRLGRLFYEYAEQCTTTPTESTSSTEQEDTTSVKEGRKRGRRKTGDTKVVDEV